jgi:hypothetical protein
MFFFGIGFCAKNRAFTLLDLEIHAFARSNGLSFEECRWSFLIDLKIIQYTHAVGLSSMA